MLAYNLGRGNVEVVQIRAPMNKRTTSRTAPWAPTLLRLAVGITFVWAGLGKWFGVVALPASSSAVLQEMGAASFPIPLEADAGADRQPPQTRGADAAGAELRVRRVWGLAIRIHESANPKAAAMPGSGSAAVPMALWPSVLGSPTWCAWQAWAVMVVEAVLGALLLMGAFTRVCALMLAGVMLGAMWLDQIGPSMQVGNTVLGILPRYPAFDPKPWMPILWQLGLLCSCLSLAMLGSGRVAIDRVLAGWRRDDDHDEL